MNQPISAAGFPRTVALSLAIASLLLAGVARAAEGIRPIGADGKPLNLGFENGTLKDWTATGTAFDGQPIKGDTVAPRRPGMKSNHAGDYWIGGYEKVQDDPKGTLTSAPFKVNHPWATFRFNGGSFAETRVEIVKAQGNEVIFKTSGTETETLKTVVLDLTKQQGAQIFIRLVDDKSGGWGHINFDDFLFFDEQPKVNDTLKAAPALKTDDYKYAGVSPEDAVKDMILPPGFKATLFAAEPDVVQPIAFAIDARGRLWVAEGITYPIRAPEGQGQDRIVIFEDADNDGHFDKRTVFAENLNLVSGIEVGFGGVYVGAAPYLYFIPDKNGDDKPDGPPEVLLDGFGYQDTHETLNTFTWGPDGWLYGCHGVFTHSNVGKPGTPDKERTKLTAGVWRYHPTKHTFEVFAEGTSNPWGIDFDENGQLWAEACVIPHLWHMVQGGRFQRQAGQHENPFTYDDIKQSADHVHYLGATPHGGNGKSDAAGGGHAHAGLMIYQGDNWPAEYRGKIFIGNIHGQRINMDIPEPQGSGYVGHHGADFINFNDRWSQVVNFKSGPDGGVYFIDWYDAQQCHVPKADAPDRKNGRIFKVTYGNVKEKPYDLASVSDKQLVEFQFTGNEWQAKVGRRILQERTQSRPLDKNAVEAIVPKEAVEESARNMLRRLWVANATGVGNPRDFVAGLPIPIPENMVHVAGWAIRLESENSPADFGLNPPLRLLGAIMMSPVGRLYIASALQRLPSDQRWTHLELLTTHAADATDHNLPLMYWYAAEPLAEVDASRALKLALDAKTPRLLEFMSRRVAVLKDDAGLPTVIEALQKLDNSDPRRTHMLKGMVDALGGRQLAMPKGWPELETKLADGTDNTDHVIRSMTQTLSVAFGSKTALASIRKTLADPGAPTEARKSALDTLVAVRDRDALPILQSLLTDESLRSPALRGLAAFDDAKTASIILDGYASLSASDKRDALNTLASRPTYAAALLDAVDAKKVPAADITADLIRTLRNLGDAPLDARLDKAFATTRQTPEEKLKQIAAAKAMLTTGTPGDASAGRAIFAKTCAQCHTLFDAGGNVGPNITGANRADLDYLLLNILDPNAVIPAEYRTTILRTKDGRVITGIMKKQDENTVTLAAANETVTIARKDIDRIKDQEISMMPEGLFDGLKEQEKRDLIRYLQSNKQVSLQVAQ